MLSYYVTVAIRNLAKHKAYTLINLIGLAIGLACSILIFLYLQHELSFDQHHKKADRIYRVVPATRAPDGTISYNYATFGPVAPALAAEYPEVERGTRFMSRKAYVNVEDGEKVESDVLVADTELFNIFDYGVVQGNAQAALETPFSVLLTSTYARKLFGDSDAMGQTISIKSKFLDGEFTVAGILENIPTTSSVGLKPELITSARSLRDANTVHGVWEGWFWYPLTHAYILLKPDASNVDLQRKLTDFVDLHWGDETARSKHYELLPLTELHLYGKHRYDLPGATGDINVCYSLAIIGTFVLLVACINFTNLTTARSTRRAREVAMRKVTGARRSQLLSQFLAESLCLALLSLAIATAAVQLLGPRIDSYFQIQLPSIVPYLPHLIIGGLGVGLLAGSYPAIVLSSFPPLAVLKTTHDASGGNALVRKGLVVLQFSISITLMICTIVVFAQGEFFRTADTGFDRDALILAELWGQADKAEPLKARFLQHSGVKNASITGRSLVLHGADELLVSRAGSDNRSSLGYLFVDQDFVDTYGLTVVSGRTFREGDFKTIDTWGTPGTLGVLINQKASERLGVGAGDQIDFKGSTHEVIGVVADFHYRSMHYTIRPLMLLCTRLEQAWITVRADPQQIPEVTAHLRSEWNQVLPQRPPELVFFEEIQERVYLTELKQRELYAICSGLSIAIACLGLLGLIAHTVQIRTKEIGVHKVLGATEWGILRLVTKDFLVLILIASALAYPISYYAMENWLQNFAYRIGLSPVFFILSTGLALVVTGLTIAYQALKAAKTNPVDALRYQ